MSTDPLAHYYLPARLPRGDIPPEVYIAFPATLTDMTERTKLRSWWLMGNDYTHAALQLMRPQKGIRKAIGRPSSVTFDFQYRRIILKMPSRIDLILPYEAVEDVPDDMIVAMLADFLYVEFDDEYIVQKFNALRGTVDLDSARTIVENIDPFTAIVRGLGYVDNPQMRRVLLPRVLSWFRVEGMPINILQLTQPNTAKTTFGLRSETLFNWEYINETPTLARLIFDARTASLGTVHLRNGVVFDEIDKWIGHKERMEVLLSVLNTGLEQHVWTRGISAQGVQITIRKPLPFVLFGNLPFGSIPLGLVRKATAEWLSNVFGVKCDQFIERFTYVDMCKIQVNSTDSLTYKVLPDAVIRGIVQLVQENIGYEEISKNNGRLRRHADNVYAVLKGLEFDVEPEYCDKVVLGEKPFDDIIGVGGKV